MASFRSLSRAGAGLGWAELPESVSLGQEGLPHADGWGWGGEAGTLYPRRVGGRFWTA